MDNKVIKMEGWGINVWGIGLSGIRKKKKGHVIVESMGYLGYITHVSDNLKTRETPYYSDITHPVLYALNPHRLLEKNLR